MAHIMKRAVAILLTFVMLLGMVPATSVTAFAASLPDNNSGSEPQEVTTTSDDMNLGIVWINEYEDAEEPPVTVDGTDFSIHQPENSSTSVKLRVNYSSEQVSPEGYKKGDFVITVKGIGKVYRGATLEADVAGDRKDNGQVMHDWSYTWNRSSDTYTFTNNFDVEGNSKLSGYFELVWNLPARSTISGYTQADIAASLYMPDGSVLTTDSLSFSNTTDHDEFSLELINDDANLYSYQGLTKYIPGNPDDYAYTKYQLKSYATWHSRGAEKQSLIFDPDATDIGSGAIVIIPDDTATDNGDGTYTLPLTPNMPDQSGYMYVYVAYPMDQYRNQTVTIQATRQGIWNDEDDQMDILAQTKAEQTIPGEFSFNDPLGSGDLYDFTIEKHGYNGQDDADLYGPALTAGYDDYYYLNLTLHNTDGVYTAEMVHDAIYITTQDGYRRLEAGEYDIKKLTIPGANDLTNLNGFHLEPGAFNIEIYTDTNGDGYLDTTTGNPTTTIPLRSASQTIELPKGTTEVGIVLTEVKDWFDDMQIQVDVNFHTKDVNDNLNNGEMIPIGFIKLYDDEVESPNSYWGQWINEWTEDNYEDTADVNLADFDKQHYGGYLDREMTKITFFGTTPNYQSAKIQYADMDHPYLQPVGNHFETSVKLTGVFSYFPGAGDRPSDYTLYTILPSGYSIKGLDIPEDAYDIIKASPGYTSIDVDTDYQGSGRTYIAIHFNTPASKTGYANRFETTATIPIQADRNLPTAMYGALINDQTVSASLGQDKDNGDWSDNPALFTDLNKDGNTTETIATTSMPIVQASVPTEALLGIKKTVKTPYSDSFTDQSTVVGYNEKYTYQLSFWTGQGSAQSIVITDALETGYYDKNMENFTNSEWHGALDNTDTTGTYQSVDLSLAEASGLHGEVKYSTSAETDPAKITDWSNNPEGAKAIRIEFPGQTMEPGQRIDILVHMQAPGDNNMAQKKTYNQFHISYEQLNANDAENEYTEYTMRSNATSVELTDSLEAVIVTKTDELNPDTKLKDAEFTLYDAATYTEENPGNPYGTATTNSSGYAIFHNIPSGHEYILKETKAPAGYELAEDYRFEVKSGETCRITIADPRMHGGVEVYKTNAIDNTPMSGAEFTVFDAENQPVGEPLLTDEEGHVIFTDLPWGTYTVKETKAPEGFIASDQVFTFTIDRNSVQGDSEIFRVVNEQEPTCVSVLKQDKTSGDPLPNVILELLTVAPGGEEIRQGLYITDENGKLDIEDLPYGDYVLREYRVPAGYETFGEIRFTLSTETEKDEFGYHHISQVIDDPRLPGSLLIFKSDDLGNTDEHIEGIEFTLYDSKTDTKVQTVTTGKGGFARMDNLEWGSYYLKETNAPEYYVRTDEEFPIEISGENLEAQFSMTNETRRGTVILTKYGIDWGEDLPAPNSANTLNTKSSPSEHGTPLSGAEYELYSSDGRHYGTYTTGADGTLTVNDLPWGSYYFKESKAPVGYSISNELIRFSVNEQNAMSVQELTAYDEPLSCQITITKTIEVDDINFANGDPTFVFGIECMGMSNNTRDRVAPSDDNYYYDNSDHMFFQSITFNKEFVENPENCHDGYVSQSITLKVPFGTCCVYEIDTSRYTTSRVNASTAGGFYYYDGPDESVQENPDYKIIRDPDTGNLAVYFNFNYDAEDYYYELDENSMPSGTAEFINYKYENQDYSHNDLVTNILRRSRQLTSITALYEDMYVVGGSAVDPDKLTVTANYDDGTSELLDPSEYELDQYVFPDLNGHYSIKVTHTENDVTRSDGFSVFVEKSSRGEIEEIYATYIDDPENPLYIGQPITADRFKLSAITTMGETIDLTPDDVYIWSMSQTYATDKDHTGKQAIAIDEYNTVRVVLKIDTDISTIVNNIPAQKAPSMLETGLEFNARIRSNTSAIIFSTDAVWSDNTVLMDVSAFKDGSVVAWYEGNTMYVRNRNNNDPVIANPDSAYIFATNARPAPSMARANNITTYDAPEEPSGPFPNMPPLSAHWDLSRIDISNLDTSKTTDMSFMFYGLGSLSQLTLSPTMDTSRVTNMMAMFCSVGLDSYRLNLPDTFVTDNVTNMSYMFAGMQGRENYSTKAGRTLDISNFNTSKVTTMAGMFAANSMDSIAWPENFDTSNVTDMSYMFTRCWNLDLNPVANFDTSKVSNMSNMFSGTTINNPDLFANWDTSLVTDMESMFEETYFENGINLNTFDTTNVLYMDNMFHYAGVPDDTVYTLDLSQWNTSHVISMGGMFSNLQPISSQNSKTIALNLTGFDTSSVQNMSYMFYSTDVKSLDISSFNTSKVADMTSMFADTEMLTDIALGNQWDTGNVTSMSRMFDMSGIIELNTSDWNTSSVNAMNGMFMYCENLKTIDVSKWDTSNVTTMDSMFSSSKMPTIDLSSWDFSSVSDMSSMFSNAETSQIIFPTQMNSTKLTDMRSMFSGCSNLENIDVSGFNTENVTNMAYLFSECTNLMAIDVSSFNTQNVEEMTDMFQECSNLTQLDLSSFDTSQVTSMGSMFYKCPSLKQIIFSDKFNSNKVTSTAWMFSGCTSLKQITLPETFTAEKVTSMYNMFSECHALETLDLSHFNTTSLTNMHGTFWNCRNLTDLNISNFDTRLVTDMSDTFDGCRQISVLDLSSFDMSKVTKTTYMMYAMDSLTTGYARTEKDAQILNSVASKPSKVTFAVKDAA